MIISQTPYRVSFAGGGTDLPAFYRRGFGAVLSTTIDQHIYVTIHRRFEPTIRVSYSRTEIAGSLDEVQHELVREAMRLAEVDEPLEVTTIGDVPAGSGMGSSRSLTVGLLTALYGFQHRVVSPRVLAERACRIEIGKLGKPIGRQDQYAAAFGGVNVVPDRPARQPQHLHQQLRPRGRETARCRTHQETKRKPKASHWRIKRSTRQSSPDMGLPRITGCRRR
jgi:D-glycero-alpha-D-manno-heptose-7-phosphate kinase